ncbi:hypothetical protein B835_1295 [Enterococcus mundtii 3F]|uniref:hypothetical protein n=1 Tax=Enterococcus mundtii TaxID=53346 RepID=UPI00230229A2|nr:hypothetical protein [Enterococcus mundtii]MDA9461400.1 hypothetical protein [Enterococcus mundtii 3F]
MIFFAFIDPNRRPQAEIKKMTEELTQKFQAIDPDLTLIHNDNFIDYGPEVFPKLSKIYWDPRVPDHPMEHFVYSEYQLKYRNYPFYWFTPYGERIYKSYKKPAGESDPWREALDVIDSNVLKVIHDYQVHNILYWKDLFTEKQLEQERLKPHKRVSEFVGLGKIISSPFSFIDPKHRTLAAVKKNTEFFETQLDHLDSRLTVVHDDSYIDFGPDIGHFLAECPYDPEEDEPDDPRRYLSNEEYTISYGGISLFGCSPYQLSYGIHGDFYNEWMFNTNYLGLSEQLNNSILAIIYQYQQNNLYYWRTVYTPEMFQKKINEYKDRETWRLDRSV